MESPLAVSLWHATLGRTTPYHVRTGWRQYIRVITLRLGFAAASCRAEALIVVLLAAMIYLLSSNLS